MADEQTPQTQPVTDPAGQKPTLTMRLTYRPQEPLDKTIVENRTEAEWQDAIQRETRAAAALAQEAEGEVPAGEGAAKKPPMKPSMFIEGLKAGAASVVEGARGVAQGLAQLPDSPAQGSRKVLVEGLMPIVFSPLTTVMASIGQSMENFTPEVSNAELFDASAAFTVRHLLAGAPALSTIPPAQLKAMQQPMTVREAIETLGPLVVPALPKIGKAAKAGAEAVKAAGSQRGSIGPPNEGAAFKGQGTPGSVSGDAAAGAKAEPKAGGVPVPPEDVEVRLNLGRIDTSDSVLQTIADLNKFAGEHLKEHRKRKGHRETVAEAQASRWTLEQMLSHDPETILVDEAKGQRLRDTSAAAAEYYDTLGRRALGGDRVAEAQLDHAFAVAVKLAALDEGLGRNIARGLEMRKEMALGARAAKRAAPESILEISRRLGGGEVDPLLRYRRVAALNKTQERGFFRALYDGLRAGRDIMHTAWINALLTNPQTHVANLSSTGLVVYGDIAETYAAGWVNRLFRQDTQGVQRAEAGVKFRALAKAHEDGWRLMVKAWETGEEPFGNGKTSDHPRLSADAYGFDTSTWFGRTIDTMGHALQSKGMPTRGLIAEDAYWKGVAKRLEIEALSIREAMARGKEGPALEQLAGELSAKPPAWMREKAEDHATLLTLNRDLGRMGQAFTSFANAAPLGRVIFPFIRTPANEFKWTAQRMPYINMLSYQNWSDINAGGALRDRAIARMALGSAAATIIAAGVANGTITGPGPIWNRNLAAMQRDSKTSTKPPFSLCPTWTDECFSLSRLGPMGTYIGAVASYVELRARIPDNQEAVDEWAAYGGALVVALGQVSASKTWAIQFRNVIDAQNDPTSAGAKFFQQMGKSLVPAGIREIAREVDGNTLREVEGFSDAVISGIPFLSSGLPAHRNHVTGEEVAYAPGWGPDFLSPVAITKLNTHPVWKEIQGNEANFPPPPHHIGGSAAPEGAQMSEKAPPRGIKLTDEQYDRLITLQTQEIKINGRNLFQALEHLVASKEYQKFPPGRFGTRKTLLEATYTGFRDKAATQLTKELGLGPRLKELGREALKPRLPVTDSRSPSYQGAPSNLPSTLGR